MSSKVSFPSNYPISLSGGLAISATMEGDPNKPIATLMTGDAAKPIATLMTGDVNKPIATMMMGDVNKPITAMMQGDPSKPIAATIELMNLPKFTLADIKDLMTPKLRIRMPNYTQVCFKLLGTEIFSLCMSGEAQTITEPYVPNAFENCDTTCCEPDTRPFPEQKRPEPTPAPYVNFTDVTDTGANA